MAELLNCPFCGRAGMVENPEPDCFAIGCDDCCFSMMDGNVGIGWYATKEEAIAAWNRRVHPTDDLETCTRHSCKRKEALRGVDLEQFRPAVEAEYFAWLSIPTNLQTAAGLMRADQYATLRRLCESLIDNAGKEGGNG